MDLLAIETSGEIASVALQRGDTVLERRLQGYARHAEHVLPAVQAVLEEAGLAVGQLSAIAFGAGPGAFTGLRLACAVAQGLAMPWSLPLVPVGSLEALAAQAGEGTVLALADARMGQCYHAWFRCCGGRIEALAAAGVDAPEALFPPAGVGPWHVIGQGMEPLWPRLPEAIRAGAVEIVLDATVQSRDLLPLARRMLAEGRALPPWEAAPYYVRDKVALTAEEQAALRQRRVQAS